MAVQLSRTSWTVERWDELAVSQPPILKNANRLGGCDEIHLSYWICMTRNAMKRPSHLFQ